jgi:hypothetical protein
MHMRLIERVSARAGMARVACWVLGASLIAQATGTHLLASVSAVTPEIDAGSMSAGLALLAGGVLILRSRGRRK